MLVRDKEHFDYLEHFMKSNRILVSIEDSNDWTREKMNDLDKDWKIERSKKSFGGGRQWKHRIPVLFILCPLFLEVLSKRSIKNWSTIHNHIICFWVVVERFWTCQKSEFFSSKIFWATIETRKSIKVKVGLVGLFSRLSIVRVGTTQGVHLPPPSKFFPRLLPPLKMK